MRAFSCRCTARGSTGSATAPTRRSRSHAPPRCRSSWTASSPSRKRATRSGWPRSASTTSSGSADYHRLQWFDRFSLAFCLRGWDEAGEPFEVGSFRFEPVGPWRARVSPWPFAEAEVECSLVRRLVPKREWRQEEFRDAFFGLPAERVSIGFVE